MARRIAPASTLPRGPPVVSALPARAPAAPPPEARPPANDPLELFAAHRAEIALVLLDMSMPCMDRKDVLENLRKIDEHVPVLIFSGFSEEQVQRHVAGLQISGFLQKPFTSHQIASAVHAMLPQLGAAGGS